MNILKIIPQVSAQSDAIAQPTFGNINIGDGQTLAAQVLLSTSTSSVEVGKKFTVKVEVKTNDITINSYNIVVQYDPSILSVVDENSEVSGTQVKLLDTIFTTNSEPEDNYVDIVDGEINVKAGITEGSGLTVNRNVVEITFQTQSVGNTTIKIKEGANGTQLIRPSGQTIQYTSNQRNIDIVEQIDSSGEPVNQTPNPQPSDQTPSPSTNPGDLQQNEQIPVAEIPNTSIGDNFGSTTTLAGGIILILISIILFLKRGTDRNE